MPPRCLAGQRLHSAKTVLILAMPTAMRVWAATPNNAPCPVNVRERKDWLENFTQDHEWKPIPAELQHTYSDETVILAEELWFKYEKDLPDVVRGLSLTVKRGEFLALLGGNGTGKTTSLKLLSGLLDRHPYDLSGGSNNGTHWRRCFY